VRRQHKGPPSHPSPVRVRSGATTPDDGPEDLAAWSLLLQPEEALPPFLPTAHTSDSDPESTTTAETCSELSPSSSSASLDEQGPGHTGWTTSGAAAASEGFDAPAVVSPAGAGGAPPLLAHPTPDAPVVVWSPQPPPVALHPGAPFPFPYPYAVAFQPPPPPFVGGALPFYPFPPHHPHPAPFGYGQACPSLGGPYPEAGGTWSRGVCS
jgi:hypothetical protein